MIEKIKRNWVSIERSMKLSMNTDLGWKKYSQNISNGLSNNILTSRGEGAVIYFVENMNYYSTCDNSYLKIACNLSIDEIAFISKNRAFLLTIK